VNLTEHEYSRDGLSSALWNGVAGTSMPAWRDYPAPDLSAVAQVVRGFGEAQTYAAGQDADLGSKVYTAHCAQCHGENGAGEGSAADQFGIAPTNFRAERANPEASLRAVRDGVEGTKMAPWSSKLSEGEVAAVANFVRGFFVGGQ
jgi:mono/diheme cytochrome c family protein